MVMSLLLHVFPSHICLIPRYFGKVECLGLFVRLSRRDLDRGGVVLFTFWNFQIQSEVAQSCTTLCDLNFSHLPTTSYRQGVECPLRI